MPWGEFFVYYLQAGLVLVLIGFFLGWMWTIRTGEIKDRTEQEWRIRNHGVPRKTSSDS